METSAPMQTTAEESSPLFLEKKAEVESQLRQHGVDFSMWGTSPGSKRLEDLVKELLSRESYLSPDPDDPTRIRRELRPVLGLQVFAVDAGVKYRLNEALQIWKNPDGTEDPGKLRVRLDVPSVGEKLGAGEDLMDGARRALEEELGIPAYPDDHFRNQRTIPKLITKESYPNLPTLYIQKHFDVILDPKDFRPNGTITREGDANGYAYVEKQEAVGDKPGKNTYFRWENVTKEDESRLQAAST